MATTRDPAPAEDREPPAPEADGGAESAMDPLDEAEKLRVQLRTATHHAARLVVALKRQRRQSKLVATTLASLRQLSKVG